MPWMRSPALCSSPPGLHHAGALQTPRRPPNAEYYAQAAAESCLFETAATPEKDARGAALSDSALVSTTMAHLEELRAALAAAAVTEPRRSTDSDHLETLMGSRMWLPTALAAAGVPPVAPPVAPAADDCAAQTARKQREEWLSAAPGAGPRFRSPGELEVARQVREVTLATGRAPTGTALEKMLGRAAMEEREERRSRMSVSSTSSCTSLELPALDSRVAAEAALVAQRVGEGDMDRAFAAMHEGGGEASSEANSGLPFSINVRPCVSCVAVGGCHPRGWGHVCANDARWWFASLCVRGKWAGHFEC